jgi:hypothetical protein
MTAFDNGRNLEIFGTKARLRGGDWTKHSSGADIVVIDHDSGNETRFNVSARVGGYDGHGGGDPGLVVALYDEMTKPDATAMRSSIHTSVQSHAMGYAAEHSRKTGKAVEISEFVKELEAGAAKA